MPAEDGQGILDETTNGEVMVASSSGKILLFDSAGDGCDCCTCQAPALPWTDNFGSDDGCWNLLGSMAISGGTLNGTASTSGSPHRANHRWWNDVDDRSLVVGDTYQLELNVNMRANLGNQQFTHWIEFYLYDFHDILNDWAGVRLYILRDDPDVDAFFTVYSGSGVDYTSWDISSYLHATNADDVDVKLTWEVTSLSGSNWTIEAKCYLDGTLEQTITKTRNADWDMKDAVEGVVKFDNVGTTSTGIIDYDDVTVSKIA